MHAHRVCRKHRFTDTERGRSSGVEHNLAKVGVVGSNPIARSRLKQSVCKRPFGVVFVFWQIVRKLFPVWVAEIRKSGIIAGFQPVGPVHVERFLRWCALIPHYIFMPFFHVNMTAR